MYVYIYMYIYIYIYFDTWLIDCGFCVLALAAVAGVYRGCSEIPTKKTMRSMRGEFVLTKLAKAQAKRGRKYRPQAEQVLKVKVFQSSTFKVEKKMSLSFTHARPHTQIRIIVTVTVTVTDYVF
jgi:hypothetical protein